MQVASGDEEIRPWSGGPRAGNANEGNAAGSVILLTTSSQLFRSLYTEI